MESDGQSEAAIRAFESAYAQLTSGQATMIPENGIIPASKLPELDGACTWSKRFVLISELLNIKELIEVSTVSVTK